MNTNKTSQKADEEVGRMKPGAKAATRQYMAKGENRNNVKMKKMKKM